MHPLRALLLPLFVLVPGLLLAAPGPVKKGSVTAELVAGEASIQPGRPFLVALKLNHDAHWHTYWINPGTGYPTSLHWQLPAGFSAGPVLWPTPHVVKDTKGMVTGHGYEGETFLFVEITPPAQLAPGTEVLLRAKADWLMCAEVCMPGDADLELALPVRAEPPAPNLGIARLFNNAHAALPQPLQGWTITAARTADTLTVRLTPADGAAHRPRDLHLFDAAGLVDYAAPQTITEENGAIVISLVAAKDGPTEATRLAGILSSANGWGGTTPGQGASFDVELAGGQPAGSSGGAAAGGPVPNPKSQGPASGLAGTMLLALVGGLILNLMPCVFPVLGIKVLGFVNQAGHDRRKVVAHGLVYTFGVLLSFWILAGVILALRASGQEIGWGAQLQSPGFVFGMAVFLLIFSLNLSGLFEIGLAATAVGGKLQMKSGYSGSFFSGILAVLVSTPCSAPFLAPALGAAFSTAFSATESMLIFTMIAIGLASPYLLLSLFPAAVRFLPRPGAWM
ncbi:MAG TPA: protein-disulfide reductase DsbD domain-containing protein, partial [Lacunisphaera sp.]|nr:protein-disulfide reductase DsbD domain-containing protein [Lacunisphaera sp.]